MNQVERWRFIYLFIYLFIYMYTFVTLSSKQNNECYNQS